MQQSAMPLPMKRPCHKAVIRYAFANEETLPQEKQLLDAIGKLESLTQPRDHPVAPLIDHYTRNGCPVDCGEDWDLDHIEAAIARERHAGPEQRTR